MIAVATGRVLNIRDLGRTGTWPTDIRRIDRRTPYGNPFRIDGDWITWTAVAMGHRGDEAGRRAASLALYRGWLTSEPGKPFAVHTLPDDPTSGAFEYSDGTVRAVDMHARAFAAMAATLAKPPQLPDVPDLSRLRGVRLACWCRPAEGFNGRLLCHGQVIVGVLDGVPPESVE